MTTTSVTTSTTSVFTETSGNELLVLSGGNVTGAIIDSGGLLVVKGGVETSATISAGGVETVSSGSASSDLIFGTVSTISGNAGVFANETVEGGGVFNLLNGNTASGTTVLSGGLLVLSGNNGALTNTVLSGGGTLELNSPKANISGSLTFEGGGNTLDVAVSGSAGFGDLATISGFSATDLIDVTVLGAGATLTFATSGGNEDVTVSGTGGSEKFIFSGMTNYTSSTLSVVSSGGKEYVEYAPAPISVPLGTTTSVSSVASATYIVDGVLDVVAGGSVASTKVDSGGVLAISGGAETSATILAGGTEMVSIGSASGDLIYGTISTVSGGAGAFANEIIENGGVFNLLNGNTATGTTVLSGGLFLLSGNNGAVTSTVLSGGGTLELDSPKANVSGSLTFAGGGNTLDIAVSGSAGYGDLATISGFSATDKIDVTVLGAGATLTFATSGGNEIVTVSAGSKSESLIFSGTTTYTSSTLSVVSSGGSEFVEYTSASGGGPITVPLGTTVSVSSVATSPYIVNGVLDVVSGGTVSGTTVNAGGVLAISGGAETSATISAGGVEIVSAGSASGDLIYGTVSAVSGSVTFANETVENGGVFNLLSGSIGDPTGTTVLSGGLLFISDSIDVTNTVLSGGGTLELASPSAELLGSLTFMGGGNTLDVATVPGFESGDLATISGFSSTDKIDVTAIGSGAALSFSSLGGNEFVTESATNGSATFVFSGTTTYTSNTLSVVSSGGKEYIEFVPPPITVSSGTTTSVSSAALSTYVVDGVLDVLSGGSVANTKVDNGGVFAISGGAETSATISAGGVEMVSVGSASSDLIYGTISTVSGGAGAFVNETVENGGVFNLLNGNTATGTTVLSGGLFVLSGNNGTVTSTVLSGGGTVELDSPKAHISDPLTFEGGGNTLDIAVVADATFGDLAAISGFSSTDRIDVTAFGAGALLSFATSGGNEQVTISGAGGSETLTFSGATTYTSATLGLVASGGNEYVEYSTSGFTNIVTSVTSSTASGAFSETSGNTLLVLSSGSVSAATIFSGGFLVVDGGSDVAAIISSGGLETISAGSATGDQIFGSAIVDGGTVTNETVLSGGNLTLSGASVVGDTVLSGGGLVDLGSQMATLSGSIVFTGGGDMLEASAIAGDGFGDQAVISGFSTSDKIDVTGINPTGAQLSFNSNGSGGEIVTISGMGGSESFNFSDAQTYNSGTMALIPDGGGGVDLILKTAPVVTFTSLGGETNQATTTVNGTVNTALDPEAIGTTVTIDEGDTVVGTATVGANGHWSANVAFTNDHGANILTASDVDGAGGSGATSQNLAYNVNTTAPAFTHGNLVISISGDGDGSGSYGDNQASALTLEQITTSGTYVSQLVLPQTTTVVNGVTEYAFSAEYGSSSEGTLELSADGHSLVIAGYAINAQTYNAGGAAVYGNAALAQSTSLQGGQFTPVARLIADINASGSIDTSTALYNVFNTNNPRSVATVDGSSFYITGQGVKGDTTQGVFYATDGASSATAINNATDTRVAEIYNGQIYVSADSTQGATNISNYGALPTSATTPIVLTGLSNSFVLNGTNGNTINAADSIGTSVNLSPENFFFANADTLYVADGGAPKEGGLGDGGLQKWVYNGTQWTLEYTLSDGLNLIPNTDTGSSGDTGLIGLTGEVEADGTVELYATTEPLGDLGATAVVSITDTLSSTTGAGESFTTLYTAAAGENIRGISFAPTAAATNVDASDFNGDVYSDIIFQNTDSSVAVWEMNGASINLNGAAVLADPGSTWKAIGGGDFYGNGLDDILFQQTTGNLAYWGVTSGTNGPTLDDSHTLELSFNPGPSWAAVALGDFNGDGMTDIVFQNTNDGSVELSEMNGASVATNGTSVLADPGTPWHVRGTGDFFDNGGNEILFQKDDGTLAIWGVDQSAAGPTLNMSETAPFSADLDPGPSWVVKGVGDVNGDGHADVVFQNTLSGDVAVWEMNGASLLTPTSAAIVASPGTTWQVTSVGDYNGDGMSDILLQNSQTGELQMMFMNGLNVSPSSTSLSATIPGTTWTPVA